MSLYEYRCERDGLFDVARPLGTAPPTFACPTCGRDASRAISAPMVLGSSRCAWSAAIERAESKLAFETASSSSRTFLNAGKDSA